MSKRIWSKILLSIPNLTSHKLRGPLARVLGLIKLINKTDSEVFRQELVAKLEVTSRELDEVIRAMNDALNRTAYDLIIEKREQEQDVN